MSAALAVFSVAVLAAIAVPASANFAGPSSDGRANTQEAAAPCTAAEKKQRIAALNRYRARMMRARQAYFRSHQSRKARHAFVRRQRTKLGQLRRAAACRVVPTGARVVATLSIPDEGPATVGANAVWVVDRASRTLFRVDATTNAVTDQINGVVGAQAAFGFGSVWLGAFTFNAVLRVNAATRQVSRFSSGPSDEGPEGIAITATAVWVANHHGGTVVQLDPVTGGVVRSVQVVAPGIGGPQYLVADGGDLWVGLAAHNAVARIDIATATVVQRISVPGGACGGIAADPARIWIAGGRCGRHPAISAIDRQTSHLAEVPISGTPIDVAAAFGSVWAATTSPARLLRIDPVSGQVVGILDLRAPAGPAAIAIGGDALWVRVAGSLLRVIPQG